MKIKKYKEISLLIQQECAVLNVQGMNKYIADHLSEKIVTFIIPELDKAEKWDILTKKYPHFCKNFKGE